MTREEQRVEEAKNRFSDDQIYPISKIYAFIEGAKWSDENPKSDMVNKQEFIEKAKAWVKNCFTGPFAEGMADNIADEFEKYMKK